MEDALEPHALFGGAMTLAIPARFADISDFRPIPDHQEARAQRGKAPKHLVQQRPPRLHKLGSRPALGGGLSHPPAPPRLPQVFADAAQDQSLIVEILVRRVLPPSLRCPPLPRVFNPRAARVPLALRAARSPPIASTRHG